MRFCADEIRSICTLNFNTTYCFAFYGYVGAFLSAAVASRYPPSATSQTASH